MKKDNTMDKSVKNHEKNRKPIFFNSCIFLICTVGILIVQNKLIENSFTSIVVFTIAILGAIYAVYASEINKKLKFITSSVYLISLIIYVVEFFL